MTRNPHVGLAKSGLKSRVVLHSSGLNGGISLYLFVILLIRIQNVQDLLGK